MKQEKNNIENNNEKITKVDFMAKPKKVYSQNFSIEKDVDISKEKKKNQPNIFSWILSGVIILVSVAIIVGAYFGFPYLNHKLDTNKLLSSPEIANSLNFNFIKINSISNLPTAKFNNNLTAKAYGIYELSTGKAIAESNADTKLQFASLTKMLTVSTMESLFDKNTMFYINPVGVNILGSRADIKAGDKFSFTDAIYGMMLPSGNDVAISVAFQNGYEDFINKMNEIVKTLDLKNTKISNPVGFDDVDKHYSSIKDIFTISRLYLQRDINKQVAQTKDYVIKSSDPSNPGYEIKNTNDLLSQPEVLGLKTGTEDIAGQCLVLYMKVKDKEYIAVLLGSSDRFKEGQKILDWLKING